MPTFTPTVAVNGRRVAVTCYDNRNLQPGQGANWPTDYWAEYSTDGGATWGGERHLAGPFDFSTAPVARGFFLGDDEALQPSGTGFLAVYVKTNCNAPYPSSNPLCAPASSNTTPTTNTNRRANIGASAPRPPAPPRPRKQPAQRDHRDVIPLGEVVRQEPGGNQATACGVHGEQPGQPDR